MTENEQNSAHPNIMGISQSMTDIGLGKLLSGGDKEEVQAYALVAQWLAVLGQAIATEDWDIVKSLAAGDISPDDAASHFGWL